MHQNATGQYLGFAAPFDSDYLSPRAVLAGGQATEAARAAAAAEGTAAQVSTRACIRVLRRRGVGELVRYHIEERERK